MAVQVVPRRFSVEEYHLMARVGILREDDRVELLDGEIGEMAPIGSRHAACVDRLTRVLSEELSRRAIVRVQGPIRLGEHSEPQPDVTLLKPRDDFYSDSTPGPEAVLLLIEVAETTQDYDRQVKAPLYARWGVPEVWLVDLQGRSVQVYRDPAPEGYREVRTAEPGRPLAPRAFPDLRLTVGDVIP